MANATVSQLLQASVKLWFLIQRVVTKPNEFLIFWNGNQITPECNELFNLVLT